MAVRPQGRCPVLTVTPPTIKESVRFTMMVMMNSYCEVYVPNSSACTAKGGKQIKVLDSYDDAWH